MPARGQDRNERPAVGEPETLRIDKWLWFARFLKSRSLATQFCANGRVRTDGKSVTKPSHMVRAGDVLTFSLRDRVRVVRIVALGSRRGPAREAVLLYEDLTPESEEPAQSGTDSGTVAQRSPGSGRPTKRDRRLLDKLRDG